MCQHKVKYFSCSKFTEGGEGVYPPSSIIPHGHPIRTITCDFKSLNPKKPCPLGPNPCQILLSEDLCERCKALLEGSHKNLVASARIRWRSSHPRHEPDRNNEQEFKQEADKIMTTRKENNVHNWIMNGPKLVAFMGKRGELNAQDMIPRYVWVDIQTDVKATRPANAPALSIGKIKARAPLHVETSDAGPSNWQDRGSAQGGFASAASAASTPTPSAAPATATTPAGTGRVQFPSLEPVPSQAGPSAYTRNVKDRDSESRGYWRKGP